MNHPADPGQAPFANTYCIDPARRLVQIQVRKNVSTDEAVRLYARVFSERDYQPGFSLVVDRSHLIATFLYRAHTLLTTLSDVADMTTTSRARPPVFTTAMSAILPFTGSFLQRTNASEAVQHFHAWRRGSKLDS